MPSNWKLDIRVRADNRIFVSGMGLEAEWSTDMRDRRHRDHAGDRRRAGGACAAPIRSPAAASSWPNSGKVTFDGGDMFNPQLAICREHHGGGRDRDDQHRRPRASTRRSPSPRRPNLPQDEVLSRLLFGTSVTSLSPTQAIQLAAALNSLRGSGGGGLNPLGKLRSATGIDRLRVLGADKTAGRGTALAAGQYISNDIYVEVITDARGFTATQLEIALSKTLSVLSQTGSFGGSSVNLRYSKDY